MPYRPCLHAGCPRTTTSSYCELHRRDTNLARRQLTQIYHRDRGLCHLCGGPVPPPPHPGPDGPTMDHVRPKAQGGADTTDNLRLAHRRCNSSRR